MANAADDLKKETKDVRISESKKQWTRFANWMQRFGYKTRPAAFRALMNDAVERDHQSDPSKKDLADDQSAKAD